MSIPSERPVRNVANSYKTLVSSEERTKEILNVLICETDDIIVSSEECTLRNFMKKLKLAHQEFRKFSLELSTWYYKNGRHSSSSEVDDDRRATFSEYKLVYGKLNNRMSELGFELASSVGNPSEAGLNKISVDVSDKSVSEWLQNKVDGLGNHLSTISIDENQAKLPSFSSNIIKNSELIASDEAVPSEAYQSTPVTPFSRVEPKVNKTVNIHSEPIMSRLASFENDQSAENLIYSTCEVGNVSKPLLYRSSGAIPKRRNPIKSEEFRPKASIVCSAKNNCMEFHPSPIRRQNILQNSHGLHEPHTREFLPSRRPPLQSEVLREQMRLELMRGENRHLIFDGTRPEDFWGWHDQLQSKLHAAGFHVYPTDSIHALLSHTEKRPRELVNAYVNAGLTNPGEVLREIWKNLVSRYGSNDVISSNIIKKVENFKRIVNDEDQKSLEAMEDLYALCLRIRHLKVRCVSLQHYGSPEGMRIIWNKMPEGFRNQWRSFYTNQSEMGVRVSFDNLLDRINRYIRMQSNPMFRTEGTRTVKTLQTGIINDKKTNSKGDCSIHGDRSNHNLRDCLVFQQYDYDARRKYAYENRRCFNCVGMHQARNCTNENECTICQGNHITLMHKKLENSTPQDNEKRNGSSDEKIQNLCTAVTENGKTYKICSKTVVVELRSKTNGETLNCLGILDEQSSHSFIDERVISLLNIPECDKIANSYSLKTLEQLSTTFNGYTVSNLEIKGVYGRNWLNLPPCFSHPSLPDTSHEIASPEMVRQHSHIRKFSKFFPRVSSDLSVMVLVGANCGAAMQTRCYGYHYPFVHKTPLGFALVGPTQILPHGKDSSVRILRTDMNICEHYELRNEIPINKALKHDLFVKNTDDELPGLSKDDQEFLDIVNSGVRLDSFNNIEIPLPLKSNIIPPFNRAAVYNRSKNTLARLRKDTERTEKCLEIMKTYLEKGHVKRLTSFEDKRAHTFIPVFPIVNERKNKIRLVFDSSAKYKGTSLNDCLFQGPDETNRLIGVIFRFRHNNVAFAADVQSMFHCFKVPAEQHKFLCFFWWDKNIPSEKVVPYAATVHVFGNCSSPSIATFGLRYAAESHSDSPGQFLRRNVYVDDGLRSEISISKAIDTLHRARQILIQYNIRLHKIISTHTEVLNAFPRSEIAEIDVLDLGDSAPQSALGLLWNVDQDIFTLEYKFRKTDFTKRGILSAIGSLYDPLGIAAPVGLTGKLLQRKYFKIAAKANLNWDDPLPDQYEQEWNSWIKELFELSSIRLPRCYHVPDFGEVVLSELHVFCDASQESIGHVVYLRQISNVGTISVSFVYGNSKLAPRAALTVPRLELCAALNSVRSANFIMSELDLNLPKVVFYTDSNVVLGYLRNRTRRFSRYVTSRVQEILSLTTPDQWKYIQTHINPADIATRCHTPIQLVSSFWFSGPEFLKESNWETSEGYEVYELPETVEDTRVLVAQVEDNYTLGQLYRISSWKRMISVGATLIKAVYKFKKTEIIETEIINQIKTKILINVQKTSFFSVYHTLLNENQVPKTDRIAPLCPYIDNGLIKVGGRLNRSDLSIGEKHPILLPAHHVVTKAILSYCHEKCLHQGRLITTTVIRKLGFHILNLRSVMSNFLKSCSICQRLRGKMLTQKMSELPRDRVERSAPFENSGIDVCGPYLIRSGYTTRKSNSTKKVWILIFTCLYSRAVHAEILTSLDTPTFILAYRRFTALRGQCKLLRSDHGTNFIGAKNQADSNIDHEELRSGLETKGCKWELIPPKAAHMGGVWERKVGSIKKVLNASLFLVKSKLLSFEEFTTLVLEAISIVNSTPLTDIPSDPNEPFPVSPALLLTQREVDSNTPENFGTTDLLSYGSRRWRRVQYLSNQFWVRWKREYLINQQKRHKWMHKSRNVCVGDVVLLSENASRNSWPMGIISEVMKSKDGLVRRVKIRMRPLNSNKAHFKERAIHDLVMLVPFRSSEGSVMSKHD